ncbi:phosphohistidine phosphatase SixA [Ancylothrix sp. C2]|uniref:phosphohistidine phosphatase SixA n=1 Tax=Ancylothrix sp. D3o TaxID=2953691 RepID=UPI0021BA91EC|nr:phosphohistidine phosphatase SixA [Ancylothrix sp. D3o]MCT7948335.1 phosphohistidine phosphatase SixA [Ancylothrix sp. D3o]
MKLYLIRHGIAADPVEYEKDEDRPLTEDGKRKTQKIAKRLRELDLQFDLILTSPLVRAKQTAELLKNAGLSSKLEESIFLATNGDIQGWFDWLLKWQAAGGDSLALVGHQPNLANWAELLVWGEVKEKLVLKKAGIIGLILPQDGLPLGRCEMFWLTAPKFLIG